MITHRNAISKSEVYEFAENSRYWRYTDPEIEDPKSVQTYASDNVFLIVKDSNGEWVRLIIFVEVPIPADFRKRQP